MTTPIPARVAFERILVPTDFSDASLRAVAYAKCIAKQFNSQLFIAHVNQPLNLITPPEAAWVDQELVLSQVQQQLEQNGAELRSEGFRAETISLTGEIQDEVLSIVKQRKVDLIVLGTHGKKGLERLLFGSDSEAVLRHATCPAITVGSEVPARKMKVWGPNDVICATTLDPASARVAAFAYLIARQYDAQLTLFRVEDKKYRYQEDDLVRFEAAIKLHLPSNLQLSTSLLTVFSDGDPGAGIVGVAKERDSDLIVMGAHTASGATTHTMRGILPQVVADSPCPVMTVHQ